MTLDYFYGQSGELFSYFRIPKALFQDCRFRQLSTDARTLYGILLDRMSLSVKNGWLDEQGRVYIIYTVREVQESLCCAEHKAVKLFRELEDIDLIERKRRGLGRPSLIYVKDFSSGLPKAQVQNCPNSNSGAAESASLEQPKSQANKTDKNKTEWNDPDPIYSGGIREQLEDYFYQALEVDLLLRLCPDDEDTINNLDETSFVYVKGNFEPIVSEALWHECERIRKSRIVNLRLPDGETRRKGIDSTKYLWVAKLRCRCGSSYRIFNWRKLKDGTPVFGYQCNMRTVNPTRSFVLEHNMTEQLSCDAISIPEWKLELMAKKIFEKVWGNQNKAILRACKMIESCQNGKAATRMSAAPIQGQIEKIKKRKLNYAAMRADGELPREEYQALCKQADDEIAHLEQELKALSPAPEPQTVSSDMKVIYDFLSQKVDVHGACLAPELIEQFVEVVTPFADYAYRWKLNTGCKKSKEERTDLMAVSEKPLLTFTIDFETAKRYREANKMPHQFRRAAWTDLTVEVYL